MKKTIKIFVLATSVIAMGCTSNTQPEKATITAQTPIKVSATEVVMVEKNDELNYSGTIEAIQTIPITFQTSGTIEKILIEEGDQVTQGQLLATVDKGSLTSAYQGALSQYERALDAQSRLRKVYNNGSLPEIKWVEINSQVTQAKSMLEIAEHNLENCELRAPTDGIVGERNIEPGMTALQPIAPIKLVKLAHVMVKVSVPENEISQLKQGQPASIQISALNNKSYQGIIERVGVVAHRISRTYEVKIEVDNKDLLLKPGMVCEVSIQLPSTQQVILVPITAVDQTIDHQSFVYTIDRSTHLVNKKRIVTGGFIQDNLIINSGLISGDLVVTRGAQKLTDRSLVTF